MNTIRRILRPLALMAMTIAVFAVTSTAEASPAAEKFIQRLGDKALSSLTAKDLAPTVREGRVRDLLRSYFDVNHIGKYALGKHWRTATPTQRSRYLELFEDMIVKTYALRFGEYSGQSFKVGKSVSASATDSIVRSQIIQNSGPPLNVQWRVRNNGGGMKVIDVIVEDLSMSNTQRSEFDTIIQNNGGKIDALIDSLKKHKAK